MDLGLRGKVALVTGASAGIGEAVALALGAEGVRLAVAARRREIEDLAARAQAAGALEARAFTVDQSSAGSIAQLCAGVEAQCGPIEILVVNGGGPRPGTFSPIPALVLSNAFRGAVAAALKSLASETGQTISIDGGLTAGVFG